MNVRIAKLLKMISAIALVLFVATFDAAQCQLSDS